MVPSSPVDQGAPQDFRTPRTADLAGGGSNLHAPKSMITSTAMHCHAPSSPRTPKELIFSPSHRHKRSVRSEETRSQSFHQRGRSLSFETNVRECFETPTAIPSLPALLPPPPHRKNPTPFRPITRTQERDTKPETLLRICTADTAFGPVVKPARQHREAKGGDWELRSQTNEGERLSSLKGSARPS
ncbi:hypothetical protein BS50DRAFT_39664 [Corynespora cassiicola Philippines]|uniref:Uncharacterized protein n=1 Tax=Corynespora cassiicola Philippines TaxID=1448308 RepID=A0A2T2PCN1_CORCC|nr:hypothetical protein BS50DRAFT_39664 [Corynespora cassiicola Philippines]